MIDFDELDDANSAKVACVASLDNTGIPRGECSCCDCLEWLSPDETNPERFTALQPHSYNVTRRLEATSDGRKGSTLRVLPDPAARTSGAAIAWESRPECCRHCGCHAMWHEDITGELAQLNERGMLVEAQPGWSNLERALFWQTGGAFLPGLEAFSRRNNGSASRGTVKASTEEVLVSVVCPTSPERRSFHPSLYHCFHEQRHPAKELIVVETGSETGPSLCFTAGAAANDPRVTYRYYNDSASPWSIGAKRNIACYLAAGTVIVHFDDDDLYSPGYISLMLSTLQLGGGGCPDQGVEVRAAGLAGLGEPRQSGPGPEPGLVDEGPQAIHQETPAGAAELLANHWSGSAGVSLGSYMEASSGSGLDSNPNPPLRGSCETFRAEAVTFSSWQTFNLATGGFGICDVDNDHNKRQTWTLGYGFTFAYLRDVWSAHWFRDVNLGEDCDFFEALLARGARVMLLRDGVGFCAHTHHEANFSPWERDREVPPDTVSTALRDMAVRLGSGLKAVKERQSATARAEKAKAVTLTPTTAAAMQDELIAEYTKEKFQMKLHQSWWQNEGDLVKQLRERSLICLEVQGPIIERYGFPNSMEGVMLSTRAFGGGISDAPHIAQKNWLIHWLCKPDNQASTPIDQETLTDMIGNLTKNAKVRRRRT